MNLQETLNIFIKDLEERRFYDAHEDMEAYWHTIRKTDHPLKNLCKGFINGATAFELIRLERYDAAGRVWKTYEKYLLLLDEDIEAYPLFMKAYNILYSLYQKHQDILK
ncbi:MAG: hypothetical protein DSZ05_03480 [Sulfurospirillum sp.]|nr:MAG: hypothetical protein DSZ05_03480 [Sulfurospirillum sp.]